MLKLKVKNDKQKQFIRHELKSIIFAKCLINSLQIFFNIIAVKMLSVTITEATQGNIRTVLLTGGILVSLVVGKSALYMLAEIPLEKKKSQKVHTCKMKFYEHFFYQSLQDLYSQKIGETKEKLNDDFGTVINKYITYYPDFVVGLISVVVYFVYLFFYEPLIAWILLFISVVQFIPPLVIKKFLQVNYDNCRDIEAKITDFIIEGYRGFLVIKLYNLKNWWQDKLARYHKEYSRIGSFSIYAGTAESVLDELVSNILSYGTYGIVGLLILKNLTTLDIGIQAIALSGSLFGAVKTSFELIKNLAVSQRAEVRLSKSFDAMEDSGAEIKQGNIEVSQISYSYEEKEILSQLTVSLDAAKLTVIKGCNGSGKSTFLRLLTGVLESKAGKIKIDGICLAELSSSNFPKKIFFLPQDDVVFHFSAYELYNMILPEQKEKAVELAKRFGLTDDVIFQSKIDELSGGERKKVFLSLAFAINPVLILLDEPTNSLDEEGKILLRELLRDRDGGAIVITHDSFMDDIMDSEYVMGKGDADYEYI